MEAQELFKKIRRMEIIARHLVDSSLAGEYLSSFKGAGLEFSEVREYEPGDEVRLIDWNVTARMGRPFLKVYQEERELTLVLAVDVSGSQATGSAGDKRELAAQVAAALGLAATSHGDRVGFLFFSDRLEGWLPPRRGKGHLLRGLRELLTLEPKGRGSSLTPMLQQLGRVQKRRATVFLVSDLLFNLEAPSFSSVALRHDLVAVRTVDPLDETLPAWLGLLAARDPETGRRVWLDTDSPWARRAWAKKREAVLLKARQSLRRRQVDLVETSTQGDLGLDLFKFFRTRQRRGLA
ncbi:MAG TPA: DUF58 domain-containing protein [bacterium]|jgi:uncharacterized protein (DUF58 family)|nr:DUF58 domain-containing protein [bacterium]